MYIILTLEFRRLVPKRLVVYLAAIELNMASTSDFRQRLFNGSTRTFSVQYQVLPWLVNYIVKLILTLYNL